MVSDAPFNNLGCSVDEHWILEVGLTVVSVSIYFGN